MAFYSYIPPVQVLLLPLVLFFVFFVSLSLGLVLTALNVKYRDFRYVIPFIVQIGLYISPVGFSSSEISSEWKLIYDLNPMVGVIDIFRWCIVGGEFNQGLLQSICLSFGLTMVCFIFGIRYFRKVEKTFADII
jgi:lipopolysaccharide transport system permease protein